MAKDQPDVKFGGWASVWNEAQPQIRKKEEKLIKPSKAFWPEQFG